MSGQACEQLTLFQGASPASRFPLQESEKEKTTTVISGLKCAELSQSCGPLGLLEKTLLASSLWSSRLVSLNWSARRLPLERVRTYEQYLPSGSGIPSPESCKTLSVSDMPSGYLYFRLVVSGQTTGVTESQLWATPNTMDSLPSRSYGAMKRQATNGGRKNRMRPGNLREQIDPLMQKAYDDARVEARLWPTPKAQSYKDPSNAPNRKGAPDLQTVVQMMPTPVSGDCQGSHGGGMSSSLRTFTHMFPTPAAQDAKNLTLPPSQADRDTLPGRIIRDGQQGQLNPDWVEWLMGFPPEWTGIDTDAEITPRDPQWWDVEPPIPRVATGVAHRVGRLKCLGNAVVPAQFYPIFAAIAAVESDNKL